MLVLILVLKLALIITVIVLQKSYLLLNWTSVAIFGQLRVSSPAESGYIILFGCCERVILTKLLPIVIRILLPAIYITLYFLEQRVIYASCIRQEVIEHL